MNIKEKAKRYDEVLNRAKITLDCCGSTSIATKNTVYDIFPELKESEDEKIRKAVIEFFELQDDNTTYSFIPKKDILAWLEKQAEVESDNGDIEAEQEDIRKAFNKIRDEKQGEQKLPIEKFHEGEWVVFNDRHESVYQIEKIENFQYTLRHILGGSMPLSFSDEDMIRAWTIQDAKPGDVLACGEEILLLKSYSAQGRISLYCWYNGLTNNFHSKEVVDVLMTTRNKICPATKEQRDTLIKAMIDAGYTFDFEKKELKKLKFKVGDTMRTLQEANDGYTDGMPVVISIDNEYYHCTNELIAIKDQDDYEFPPINAKQKPADKVEPKFKVKYAGSEYNVLDIKEIAGVTYYVIEDEPNHIDYVKVENCEIVRDYSYGVKEKGSPYPIKSAIFTEQKPAEWSKEDEAYMCDVIAFLEDARDCRQNALDCINWLKSLKERYTWKPTKEQLKALWEVYKGGEEQSALASLYTDLNKLKGE